VYNRLPFEAAFLTWPPFATEKEFFALAEAGERCEVEKEWL
jgi:hypothetical protein